jgi:hypothetical protein
MKSKFTHADAIAAAKANAAHTDQIYAVFLGSDLQWRSIGVPRDTHVAFEIVYPDGTVVSSSVETTVGELKKRRVSPKTPPDPSA